MTVRYRGRKRVGTAGASLAAVCLLLVSGCAETELAMHAVKQMGDDEPRPAPEYKIGKPYRVGGVWYYPSENYRYVETGVASWYGPDFHGRKTANGEVYNMNDLTAAHRTLPLPSIVRVTNLRNGRSIKVRVNDRGPFARGRIIDLSRRSAQLLGVIGEGTAPVRVEIVPDESRRLAALARKGRYGHATAATSGKVTAVSLPVEAVRDVRQGPVAIPAAAPVQTAALPDVVEEGIPGAPLLFVQAGAFIERERADRLKTRLSGIGGATVVGATVGERRFYRVRIGPLATVDEGDRVLDRVVAAGFPEARLVVD